MPKTPAYRKRSGYDQAIVTLSDSKTKKRRDFWLGPHGSAESREMYHRLIAAWESAGRQLPEPAEFMPGSAAGHAPARHRRGTLHASPDEDRVTVAEIVRAYWAWARANHRAKRASNVKATLRLLRRLDGTTAAEDFGPRRLRLVRDAMVLGDAEADPPREPWSRRTANERVRIITAMFRWAAAQEMIPPTVPQALSMLEPLKRGQSAATEPARVRPVEVHVIEATKRHVSRQVAALIDLQLLTGARPGELLRLRACDIDRSDPEVWSTTLATHKNAHRGHERVVYFGPEARRVLLGFMAGRHPDVFLFSPSEAETERRERLHAARRTPLTYGNRPGTNRRERPARPAGDCYTTDSYRRAIERACDITFPPPEHLRARLHANGRRETEAEWRQRLTAKERAELEGWRKAHRWHPHQLRHTAATRIRRECGLEAAQLVLGHSSALVTEAVYAARDQHKIVEVVRRMG
ncbi:MAG: site-specific integrase [Phycisphaerales bacterium]|nr:site-specific integrase [Phycisphaerales bacterium]